MLSEIELKDEDLRLRGQLDLLLVGNEIVVVDLKTQTLLDEGLPDWVEFQLTVYAHLAQKTYGTLPVRAEVFSLNRGRREVPITEASIQNALAALATARATDPSHANPSPEVCRFCERRLECEPHWEAAAEWTTSDAVVGSVQRLEYATAGVVAALLQTASGPAWVTGIPGQLVDACPGDSLQVVRVCNLGLSAEAIGQWRWRRQSALRIVAESDRRACQVGC